MVLNYSLTRQSLLRLSASRRVTDIASSIFAPAATLLTTEGESLPNGFPDPGRNGNLRTVQLDYERYFGSGGLLKLFAFDTRARNLTYDFSRFSNVSNFPDLPVSLGTSLTLRDVQRSGAGVRVEQQLSRSLFGYGTIAYNRTTSRGTLLPFIDGSGIVSAPFNGGIAPYHPRLTAQLGLNSIDRRGNKMGVLANYRGSFFRDTADPAVNARPRFPARVTFDVYLSHEPTLRQEIFVRVSNVFDTRQIVFNDIPIDGRRITFGLTRRF
jgi:hypothetical protein